jgi:hypothetical protein
MVELESIFFRYQNRSDTMIPANEEDINETKS